MLNCTELGRGPISRLSRQRTTEPHLGSIEQIACCAHIRQFVQFSFSALLKNTRHHPLKFVHIRHCFPSVLLDAAGPPAVALFQSCHAQTTWKGA